MKRILFVLLAVLLLYQAEIGFCAIDENIQNAFAENSKNPYTNNIVVQDELVETTLLNKYAKPSVNNQTLQDDFVLQTLNNNYKKFVENKVIVKDFVVDNTLKANYEKPYSNLNYNYESIKYALFKVRIDKKLSSRNAREGQKILFKTIEPVKVNDKIAFDKETKVVGNIEFVSLNEMRGEPAILIIDNFEIKNFPQYKLSGQIYKEGAKRSYWINPMSIILMPFWGTGLFLHFIRGGHAKITPNKVYKLYLWGECN